MRKGIIITLALLASAATAVPASAASFKATLHVPTHHPKANARWPVVVTARTSSGKALRATATYQWLYNNQVVATRYPSPNVNPNSKCSRAGTCRHSPWPFTGKMRDATFTWPARSVGFALTFRVVVTVKGRGSQKLNYAVRVHR